MGDRIKGILGLLVLVLAVAGAWFAGNAALQALQSPESLAKDFVESFDQPARADDATRRSFAVKHGESAARIGERLQAEGLISNSTVFRVIAEGKGVAGDLAVGEYELSPNMKPSEILSILAAGATRPGVLITIPEGWRAEEIAERMAGKGIGTADQFMALVKDGKVDLALPGAKPAGASLEGYLFPDSYRVDSKTTADSMIRRMVGQFETKFTPEMREKAAKQGMSVHQVVVLASIIEREAVVPSERATMAGVFYNRLKAGIKLDTDPTVQYALAIARPDSRKKYGWWKVDLTQEDLEVDSPYNTYRYPGLPPGPICNPGLASLQAAVGPTPSDYLYFVAKADGSHAFAKTLDEHNENVARYRK